jgi:Ser/Thr protein kinase RdoA (MazF antagonist)
VEFDHGFRRHLLARGVPTAAPIATKSGETWVLTESRAFELYPFVEGRPFGGTRAELIETARALSHFHRAAAEYPARGSYNPIPMQFAIAAPDVGGSERMDDPEVMAAAFARLARHAPALGYAVEQARRLCSTYGASVYGALPRWLIHGDYHPGNLLYLDSRRIVGIFDLDWACEHTRSRDLADGVYYFAGRRDEFDDSRIESMTEAVEPDMDSALLFLRTYNELARLEPEEVGAIPLALRARWLAERLEGSAKLPPERRVWFISRDLERPLEWLDAHGEELVRSLL